MRRPRPLAVCGPALRRVKLSPSKEQRDRTQDFRDMHRRLARATARSCHALPLDSRGTEDEEVILSVKVLVYVHPETASFTVAVQV